MLVLGFIYMFLIVRMFFQPGFNVRAQSYNLEAFLDTGIEGLLNENRG